MRLDWIDIVCFPDFATYVEKQLPKFAKSERVRKAFAKYGQIDGPTLTRALTWDRLPLIIIRDLGEDTAGQFDSSNPDQIEIHSHNVWRFEQGLGLVVTPKLGEIPRVAATLLHELVHWADHKDGKDYGGALIDEGTRFEVAVFGKNVSS